MFRQFEFYFILFVVIEVSAHSSHNVEETLKYKLVFPSTIYHNRSLFSSPASMSLHLSALPSHPLADHPPPVLALEEVPSTPGGRERCITPGSGSTGGESAVGVRCSVPALLWPSEDVRSGTWYVSWLFECLCTVMC